MGDGGFQMCIEELGTIMEQQAPVKMILMNNHYLGNVRQWQDMFWMRRKSFTKMLNPNYELIAQGYGIPYAAVTDRRDLAAAVEKMLTTDGPYILECAILEEDNVLPMTPPGMNVDEMKLEI
jgi:acetolactate synthase-1/2/3 large subunit